MEGTPHLSAPFMSCRYNPHIAAFMKVVFEQVVVLHCTPNAHHIKVTGCFYPKMTHVDILYNIDRPYNSSSILLQHLTTGVSSSGIFSKHCLRRLPHGHVLESFVDRKQRQVLRHRPFDQTLRKPFDHVWVKILQSQVFTMNICCCCFLKYMPFLLLFVGKNKHRALKQQLLRGNQ